MAPIGERLGEETILVSGQSVSGFSAPLYVRLCPVPAKMSANKRVRPCAGVGVLCLRCYTSARSRKNSLALSLSLSLVLYLTLLLSRPLLSVNLWLCILVRERAREKEHFCSSQMGFMCCLGRLAQVLDWQAMSTRIW